ncbi:MAG: glycosyl hydrolase, partial [Verrucomicrobia bacterium]|nr:glycosyl hydrolase [Verrucomicrobiota bacterium]
MAAGVLQVRVDPAITYQTIDGFGASDAWQCQFVGKRWPLEKRERIADLLFSRELDAQGNPKGIGLSIWRCYLSAGTAEQGEASDIVNPWRRGE